VPELVESHPGPVRALTGLDRELDEHKLLSPINLDDPDGKIVLKPVTLDHAHGDVDLVQASFEIAQLRDPIEGRHDLLDFTASLGIVGDRIHLLRLRKRPYQIKPTMWMPV
jgi:hypothetical protein